MLFDQEEGKADGGETEFIAQEVQAVGEVSFQRPLADDRGKTAV